MHKLKLQPVIRNDIIWHEDSGEVVLIVKNKGIFDRIVQFLFKKPRISYIHLDEIGSYIWKMIDGENSVYEIGIALDKKFSNSAFPIYDRLTEFLFALKQNKFITFRKK